ncbi:MAG: hypothetical protein FJY07_04205 [Bacteroidetes bacterium]|nr:hypothetical protein [Bacteroidota bacterium]
MGKFRELLIVKPDNLKARDSGLALSLIFLIMGLWVHREIFFQIALIAVILDMIVPRVFIPWAYLWFGLANILGTFVSKILLFIVYTFLVLPMGVVRRIGGKDSLQLGKWKQGNDSVFRIRDHLFTAQDIEKPY